MFEAATLLDVVAFAGTDPVGAVLFVAFWNGRGLVVLNCA